MNDFKKTHSHTLLGSDTPRPELVKFHFIVLTLTSATDGYGHNFITTIDLTFIPSRSIFLCSFLVQCRGYFHA